MAQPELFNRTRRRLRRDRAASGYDDHAFLRASMLDGLADRLDAVTRSFDTILDLGCFDGGFTAPPGTRVIRADAGYRFARNAGGIQCDEDRLPFADASIDCIVTAGVLDQVNDVPGTLVLARRILRSDGLFLGAFLGSGSLSTLKSVLLAAEPDRAVARIHPQIDVRAAGDLLMRAGLTLPVADVETLTVRYSGLGRLLSDLRGMGATNLLADTRPLTRAALGRAARDFADRADADGRTAETFRIVYLTGWAPDPSQPKPAARGSGSASLADALRPGTPR